MPKYTFREGFMREWRKLKPSEQRLFETAWRAIVTNLKAGKGLPAPPLVEKMSSLDIYEVRWAPNGRATFHIDRQDGEDVIIWRRIGDHEIYKRP